MDHSSTLYSVEFIRSREIWNVPDICTVRRKNEVHMQVPCKCQLHELNAFPFYLGLTCTILKISFKLLVEQHFKLTWWQFNIRGDYDDDDKTAWLCQAARSQVSVMIKILCGKFMGLSDDILINFTLIIIQMKL